MSFQLPSGLRPAQPPSGGSGGGGGAGSPGPSQQEQGEAQERQRQQEEMKRGMIASMLTPGARERCTSSSILSFPVSWVEGTRTDRTVSRIGLTRPEMASRVEELLVRMAQAGQIRGQVTDEAMKGLLQQVRPLSSSNHTLS